jgi:tetratricopeptide (TPR) repeat protein
LAFDRDIALKKAEKLLRQGRLDGAIAEYVRVVEDQPRDWTTANTLGDLYMRAGQTDQALAQFRRIADHFMREGFYPKAAAVFKKILKISPDDETSQLQLAEISVLQGLIADAKARFNAIAERRRTRGDARGASEIVVRLAALDPADLDARLLAARTLEDMGDRAASAEHFKALHADFAEKGRSDDARNALMQAVRLNPDDRGARAAAARLALDSGSVDAARGYLDRETAAGDPALLASLAELEARAGAIDSARDVAAAALSADPGLRERLVPLAMSMTEENAEAAFALLDPAVDLAIAESQFDAAARLLGDFAVRASGHVPALLKLVEVCVDGGLEIEMYDAQARLTDAYLEAGQAAEARVIAEDLVAREPWQQVHIERFRRALVMLRVSDPDTYIAERLSGHAPFTATDPFVDPPSPAAPPDAATPPDDVRGDASVAASEASVSGPPEVAKKPSTLQPQKGAEAGEIDLSGALGALSPEDAAAAPSAEGLQDVFDGLRARVADQAEGDFSAQYLKLAHTYLEMDMLDEAMSSLETAVRSPVHRFEAASLLGRLHVRRGQPQRAIDWLERAAEAPAPTTEDGRALLYDLGVLLDGAGEVARALAVFLELQADAGDYRDVPARIDRLARVQTGG